MSHPVWRGPQRRGWDPFADLQALRSELARLVGAGATGLPGPWGDLDMEEDKDGWIVTARLPGFAPEEVAIEVDDRELSIRARSEAELNEGAGSRRGSFDYRFTVPGEVDPEQVDATMDHGLLTVRLPRSARSQRRQISVRSRPEVGSGTVPSQAGAPPVESAPADTAATGQAQSSEAAR